MSFNSVYRLHFDLPAVIVSRIVAFIFPRERKEIAFVSVHLFLWSTVRLGRAWGGYFAPLTQLEQRVAGYKNRGIDLTPKPIYDPSIVKQTSEHRKASLKIQRERIGHRRSLGGQLE